MKQIRVPLSRFRREIRKWLRISQDIDVIVTKRGNDYVVALGCDRFKSLTNDILHHQ